MKSRAWKFKNDVKIREFTSSNDVKSESLHLTTWLARSILIFRLFTAKSVIERTSIWITGGFQSRLIFIRFS